MKKQVRKDQKKAWFKPKVTSIPFKNTLGGPYIGNEDVSEVTS